MANRVNVNVNVNDMSRSGLRQVRASLRQMQRALPPDHTVTLTLNDDNAVRSARRVRRALRDLPNNVTVRVNVRPDRQSVNSFPHRIRQTLTSPMRTTGAALGGTLSDGLGQGIIGAFRTAGPIGMAVLAAIIASSLALIGAALSGLITTALGLAFVGVAGVSAAMSEEVKKTWSDTLSVLKQLFADVGKPMIPVLQHSIGLLEKMARDVAPQFKKAIEDAAPATTLFIEGLFDGFRRMGKAMFGPIMEAWNVFAPIFSEVFAGFMEDLGENFGDIAKMVRDHSFEIQMALTIVFKLISGIVEVVEFLGQTWIDMIQMWNGAISIFINQGVIPMAMACIAAFESILGAAASAFQWVPGIGDKLKGAQAAFGVFKEDAISKLHAVGENARTANQRIDDLNRTRILKADIRTWEANLATARAALKKTTDQKARAKLEADISRLQANIKKAKGELASINGRTATTYVNNIITTTKRSVHEVVGGYKRAHGGVIGGGKGIGTAATGGIRGNMTLVGEAGPELVQLPTGSRVRSNPDTRRMFRQPHRSDGRSGGGVPFIIKSSGRRVDDLLLEILREAIHARGGDPVAVLGG